MLCIFVLSISINIGFVDFELLGLSEQKFVLIFFLNTSVNNLFQFAIIKACIKD